MPAAGKLNRRIAIWRAREVSDGSGGQVRKWAFVANRRVSARPSGGNQADVSGTMQARLSFRIDMRRTDIRASDRVVIDGENYRVRSVADPDGRRRDLTVLVDSEVPEDA